MELAIEMWRLDESQTLDHVAEAGPPDADVVDAIADAIAASHVIAARTSAAPWIESLPGIVNGNSAAFRIACFPRRDIDTLELSSHRAFRRVRTLVERRDCAGFVRRCHGDLHLANMVMIEGKPVLFDAIEFDPTIASSDVLYDLVFPLMDFLRYDRRAAANGLLNRYLSGTPQENLDGLQLCRSAIARHHEAQDLDSDQAVVVAPAEYISA